MSLTLEYNSFNAAFYSLLFDVYYHGKTIISRNLTHKELLFQNFTITNPMDMMLFYPHRKFSSDYAFAEWLWYISAVKSIRNIGKFAKIWRDIQDESGCVESNYGTYLFWGKEESQWNWCINELITDKYSRRATIIISQPKHKILNKLDIPCTQYIQFFIRDNVLHMLVYMRSNDIIYGLSNDLWTFILFQQMMVNELRSTYPLLRIGVYYHSAGSLHLYDIHWNMAKDILTKDIKYVDKSFKSRIKLHNYITFDYLNHNKLYFPIIDTTKKDLQHFVKKTKNIIFKTFTV